MMRHSKRDTSLAAYDSIKATVGTVRMKVLAGLRSAGRSGATDDELFDILDCLSPSSVRTRRSELEDDGLVKATFQCRKTKAGRNAIVWVASEYAA